MSFAKASIRSRPREVGGRLRLKAFTLTELLVVATIIGVLASIASAEMVAARRKSRDAQCAARLHQHGLALAAFVADHGVYPLTSSVNEFGEYPSHRRFWWAALFPDALNKEGLLVGDHRIWDCAAAVRPRAFPEHLGYTDYGYNGLGLGGVVWKPMLGIGGKGPGAFMEGGLTTARYSPPVAETEVVNPSEMVAIGDGFNGWGEVIRDGVGQISRGPSAQEFMGSTVRSHKRHRGRANLLACDGHVEAPTLEFLFREETDRALRVWNRDNAPHGERLGR